MCRLSHKEMLPFRKIDIFKKELGILINPLYNTTLIQKLFILLYQYYLAIKDFVRTFISK